MSFWTSSIGRKYLMGISGLIIAGFVLVHMAGNLIILLGEQAYNSYSHALVSNLPLLYTTEIILLLAFLTHVVMGIWLTVENRRARKVKYVRGTHGDKAANFAYNHGPGGVRKASRAAGSRDLGHNLPNAGGADLTGCVEVKAAFNERKAS